MAGILRLSRAPTARSAPWGGVPAGSAPATAPPGYGEPAQPRHRDPASLRPPQHRPPPCVRTPATPPDPSSSSASQPHEPTFPHFADALRGTTSGAAMASPWLSLYPFAVPARRPRGRSAAYSWRCCRGRAGHLPGRPGDGERRKRSVAALSTFGRGQARRPRAAGHGGVPVVVNPRAWRSPRLAAPDGGSCR
jgi:hypothetical protein